MKFSWFYLSFHNSCEIWHNLWLFSRQILLEIDWFCADLPEFHQLLFGEVCPENSHEIDRFFHEFVPKNPTKFDFFFCGLSEALYCRLLIISIAPGKCKKECNIVWNILVKGFCPTQNWNYSISWWICFNLLYLNGNDRTSVSIQKWFQLWEKDSHPSIYCSNIICSRINNNYSPKWRWLVLDIYQTAKQWGK